MNGEKGASFLINEEILRQWMKEYNESHSPELFENIEKHCHLLEEKKAHIQYEINRSKLKDEKTERIPKYEDLPIKLFFVSKSHRVLFHKDTSRFLLNESINPWYDFFSMMTSQNYTDQHLQRVYARNIHTDMAENARAHLIEMIREQNYQEEYLHHLKIFLDNSSDEERYYFAGKYAFFQGNYPLALSYGLAAYSKRSLNPNIWKLLTEVYEKLGQDEHGVFYKTLFGKFFEYLPGKPLYISNIKFLQPFILGNLNVSFAPFYWNPTFDKEDLNFLLTPSNGEFLLTHQQEHGEYRYWCGVYNSDCFFNVHSNFCNIYKQNKINDIKEYSNFIFDIVKARVETKIDIVSQNNTYTIGIAGTESNQLIHITTPKNTGSIILGKQEFRYLRIQGDAKIYSNNKFAATKPVFLQHNSKRRRLVLNVLLDGLSWGRMKKENYFMVPNLIKFFSKGIIFDNTYSVAEYTFPSLATIETGIHLHHSQIFDDKHLVPLNIKCKTVSEQMSALGYYCVNIMGDGRGIYNGVTRGFDRLISAPFLQQPTHEGVHRTVEHLEAFSECDNYIFLHISDPHTFNVGCIPQSLYTQVKVPFHKILYEDTVNESSVRLTGKEFYQVENLHVIKRMDQELKALWEYIEKNYDEDEYLVNLYSDHGSSAYTETPYYFSEDQCGSALMTRGGGIPITGFVKELTSTMDLYAIMKKTLNFPLETEELDANLPEVFGGQCRDYVISNSIYPGQTYKLCIRTLSYEFRLETAQPTRMDGTIDMRKYSWKIFRRTSAHEEVYDDHLKDFFMEIAYNHTKSFHHQASNQYPISL